MPARIVISPVDVEVGSDGITRRIPRVGNTDDPGKLVDGFPAKCVFNSAISDGQPGQENDFCLCIVAAIDLSRVDADPEIEMLFEIGDDQVLDGLQTWLGETPKGLGWTLAKVSSVKNRIAAKGIAVDALTEDEPLWEFVNSIARKYSTTPGWDVRRTKTTRAGA